MTRIKGKRPTRNRITPYHVRVTSRPFFKSVEAADHAGKINCLGANCVVAALMVPLMDDWHRLNAKFSTSPSTHARFECPVLPDGSERHAVTYSYGGWRTRHWLTVEEHESIRAWTRLYDLLRIEALSPEECKRRMTELPPLDVTFFVNPALDERVQRTRTPVGIGKRGTKNSPEKRAANSRWSNNQKHEGSWRVRQAHDLRAALEKSGDAVHATAP